MLNAKLQLMLMMMMMMINQDSHDFEQNINIEMIIVFRFRPAINQHFQGLPSPIERRPASSSWHAPKHRPGGRYQHVSEMILGDAPCKSCQTNLREAYAE